MAAEGAAGKEVIMALSQLTTSSQAPAAAIGRRALSASVLLLAGGLLVYLTGFSHSHVLHNAAHDTRHTLAFPCH